jgi:hypothetical protein
LVERDTKAPLHTIGCERAKLSTAADPAPSMKILSMPEKRGACGCHIANVFQRSWASSKKRPAHPNSKRETVKLPF